MSTSGKEPPPGSSEASRGNASAGPAPQKEPKRVGRPSGRPELLGSSSDNTVRGLSDPAPTLKSKAKLQLKSPSELAGELTANTEKQIRLAARWHALFGSAGNPCICPWFFKQPNGVWRTCENKQDPKQRIVPIDPEVAKLVGRPGCSRHNGSSGINSPAVWDEIERICEEEEQRRLETSRNATANVVGSSAPVIDPRAAFSASVPVVAAPAVAPGLFPEGSETGAGPLSPLQVRISSPDGRIENSPNAATEAPPATTPATVIAPRVR